MSTTKKDPSSPSASASPSGDDLDRLARQMLLEEAKRNKARAETHGALGWQKPTLVTNRKFLCNTLISNAVHNMHRNEQEKQQRTRLMIQKQAKDQHKRSRTPSPSSKKSRGTPDDRSSSSKRRKKDHWRCSTCLLWNTFMSNATFSSVSFTFEDLFLFEDTRSNLVIFYRSQLD